MGKGIDLGESDIEEVVGELEEELYSSKKDTNVIWLYVLSMENLKFYIILEKFKLFWRWRELII